MSIYTGKTADNSDMKEFEHLQWIHDRIINVHNECV